MRRFTAFAAIAIAALAASGCGQDDASEGADANGVKRIECKVDLVIVREDQTDLELCSFTDPVTGAQCYADDSLNVMPMCPPVGRETTAGEQ